MNETVASEKVESPAWLRSPWFSPIFGFGALVRHRWFVASMALSTFCYAWLVTGGDFNFNSEEIFGNFYDYQAASFLEGKLDVPEAAIGGEAFEANGKLYGYFGPTPALLRLPFVAVDIAFGRLSRSLMVLYFIATLLASYLLLREAMRTLTPRLPSSEPAGAPTNETAPVPSAWATLLLVASVAFGSTVFFLGSRGLIFHEAILCGITFALWSCWCTLRHGTAPQGRWWIGALGCGLLALHARPPTGLFALTFLGCIALVGIFHPAGRHLPWFRRVMPAAKIGLCCLISLSSLNALAYLKFGTFDPAPLRMSRPYFNNTRLQRIDGKSFHLVNVPFNLDTYFLFPNLRLEPGFPWIHWIARRERRPFPKAKIDLPDYTVAIPYSMPSLFALCTAGSLAAFFAFRSARGRLAALWLAVLPMTLALLAAVATAQRYTGDWCPFLIVGSAFGLTAIERARTAVRWLTRSIATALTLAAVAVTGALTLHYQGDYLWGVPEHTRENYRQLQQRVNALLHCSPPASTRTIK